MPQGLEVYDEMGRTLLDTKTYTAKVIGTLIIAPNTQGQIKHKGFTQGTPFCVCNSLDFFNQHGVSFEFDGDVMTWVYKTTFDKAPNIMLIYGVQ